MRGNGTATNEGIPTASLNGPVSPSHFFVECRRYSSLIIRLIMAIGSYESLHQGIRRAASVREERDPRT